MINDQANELRQLVRQGAWRQEPASAEAPRVVFVAAGKGGVGATTIAVNLAAACQREGYRCLLVDADPSGADATTYCGIHAEHGLPDVLLGAKTIREVLRAGPGGARVLPGRWAEDHTRLWNAATQQRLLLDVQRLGREVDIALIDLGCGYPDIARAFWRAADAVLLVSDPEVVSIMDTYAAVKTLYDGQREKPLWTVINRARGKPEAQDAHARLARACQRFLAIEPHSCGYMPEWEDAGDHPRRCDPLSLGNASPEAADCFGRLVVSLLTPAAAGSRAPAQVCPAGE